MTILRETKKYQFIENSIYGYVRFLCKGETQACSLMDTGTDGQDTKELVLSLSDNEFDLFARKEVFGHILDSMPIPAMFFDDLTQARQWVARLFPQDESKAVINNTAEALFLKYGKALQNDRQ